MATNWSPNSAAASPWTTTPRPGKSLRTNGDVSQHATNPTPKASPTQPRPRTSLALQSQAAGARQTPYRGQPSGGNVA